MKRITLVTLLICTLFLGACSTAWLTTFDSWLAIAGPAVINILELVALAKGVTVAPATLAKVNADEAALKTLATSVNTAVAADLPNACSAFNEGVVTFAADLPTLTAIGQVNDPVKLAQLQDAVALAQGIFAEIEAPVTACAGSTPETVRANLATVAARTRFTSINDFVGKYNAIMSRGADTKRFKLYFHNQVFRALSLGKLK